MTVAGRQPGETSAVGWPAPAKLNLFLHVLGRRPDGYHEIETGYQFLDWCDRLTFRPRRDGALTLSGNEAVPPEKDLAMRAAESLRAATGTGLGVDIRIEKRLPVGGGLGGGSSDAATTLVALNRLWGTGLATDRLAELGLELGADVPFFVQGHAALARGIGERLSRAEPPTAWYLVLDPGVSVSTSEIFAAPELTRNTPRLKITCFAPDTGRNDLEPVVCARYPAVAEALDWLGGHGRARVTGSGACVFVSFSSPGEAQAVAEAVPGPWRARVARGVNRSPLLDRLAEEPDRAPASRAGPD